MSRPGFRNAVSPRVRKESSARARPIGFGLLMAILLRGFEGTAFSWLFSDNPRRPH